MLEQLAQVDWKTLALGLLVLAVGWTILRFVLRLTLKIFALGCLALLALGGVAALYYFFK